MNVICVQHQGNKKELMLIEVDLLNQSPELYESRSIDFERSISSPQWKKGIPCTKNHSGKKKYILTLIIFFQFKNIFSKFKCNHVLEDFVESIFLPRLLCMEAKWELARNLDHKDILLLSHYYFHVKSPRVILLSIRLTTDGTYLPKCQILYVQLKSFKRN